VRRRCVDVAVRLRAPSMSYPTSLATTLVEQLDAIASANGGNAFISGLKPDAHGAEYRQVTADITRSDWRRIYPELVAAGWRSYGDGGMVQALPQGHFLVVVPQF
jgi:hypothetical protein